MLRLLERLWSDARGYGTVELLILVAALGVVATALMTVLKTRVQGSANTVGSQIDTLVNQWTSP